MSRKKQTTSSKNPFFPEYVKSYVAKRTFDALAVLMLGVSAFWVISILTYHPLDISLNVHVVSPSNGNEKLSNWGGALGATLSDVMIQSFGVSVILLGCLTGIGAIRLLRRIPSSQALSLRICSALACVFVLSIALAPLQSYNNSEVLYWGGAIGHSASHWIFAHLPFSRSAFSVFGISMILALIGLGLFAYTIGASRTFWIACSQKMILGLKTIISFCTHKIHNAYRWLRHYDALEWESPIAKETSITKRPAVESPKPQRHDDIGENHPQALVNAEIIASNAPKTSSTKETKQKRLSFSELGDWELPAADMLQEPRPEDLELRLDERALQRNADMLQQVLTDFGVDGKIVKIRPGPVVTLYELEPAPGVKSSKVIGLSDDIARSMSALSVRAAVVPGRSVIGIEIPNQHRQIVYLRSLIESQDYRKTKSALPLILGKDIGGESVVADLAKMPHLLIAGTTGSGKSVAVNTMILSLLYQLSPEQCRMIMIDPKMLELSVYDDIPHLLSPVVTDPGRAVVALKWAVQEMENRYRAMSKFGVRNIDGYNAKIRDTIAKGETMTRKVQTGYDPESGKPVFEDEHIELVELPYIVIIVDEFADLMLVAGKDVESAIQRLAQMARAAGIHLIMATQRPSVDVITGVIKANFPTRISFQVTSKFDSRTILGDGGAEQLLGRGDMLYMASGGKIQRVHGPFVDDKEVEDVVQFVKEQGAPDYLNEVTDGEGSGLPGLFDSVDGDGGGSDVDEMYDQAVALIAREGKASTSFIQRHLQIGYNRAARIIEEMEKQGVVGPANHVGKREILISDHSAGAASG